MKFFAAFGIASIVLASSVCAQPGAKKTYVKRSIVESRFGDAERQQWIQKAYNVKKNLDGKVIGQDGATYALQEALIQYLEGFGSRTREPVATHIIGLPGIGKTALMNELQQQGFNVASHNMQGYDSRSSGMRFNGDIGDALQTDISTAAGKPLVIVFDEIDKIPEISDGKEITQPAIGVLNDILTDGATNIYGRRVSFSNVLIITTMNFAPVEIELFAQNILKQPKSFYDFTIEDFAKFNQWLISNPGARSLVLSHLFRTNTVSRISPNTILFKPLTADDYHRIARLNIDQSIARVTGQGVGANRVQVTFSDAFAATIDSMTLVPSSGARETVFRADRLTDQLIGFATKYQDPKLPMTLDLPRKIHFDIKTEPTTPPTMKVVITVTPQKIKGKELVDLPSFTFEVPYREDVRLFQRPEFVTAVAPPVKKPAEKEKPITAKEILNARFPKNAQVARGLAKKINSIVIGQEEAAATLEEDMNKYMGRIGPAYKEPIYRIFAGFPGIGKSLLINTAADFLEIPTLRIGMQQYTGENGANEFITDLQKRLQQVKANAKNGKYILLIEEIDKIYEVNPQSGAIVPRPVMGTLKDLMADGVVTVSVMNGQYRETQTIDIRDAYLPFTMNFGADLFGFKADPRLTSPDDMIRVWKMLSTSPADLHNTLSKLYLPETVSRMMPSFEVMKPLALNEYAKLEKGVIDGAEITRFYDSSGRNVAQINLKLTAEYKRYLLDETVIPSEGARYTVMASQGRSLYDIEYALGLLKRESKYASKPFNLVLDYSPKKTAIIYKVTDLAGKNPETLGSRKVVLTFPRPEVTGMLDYQRALVSAHEFGHAFTGIRLGLRFELATVIPPETGTGGYVKFVDNGMSARAMVAQLYSSLGSRAMERIFFSTNPLEDASVLNISSGPSSDITSATKEIYNMIYNLGFDPQGGTIHREGPVTQPVAKFEDIPAEQIDAIGRVMRKMEAQIIVDLLEAHSIEWYREKISAFGHAGLLREQQFYEMIGYPYPGEESGFLSEGTTVFEKLKGIVAPLTDVQKAAMGYRQGDTHTTASENMDEYLGVFKKLLASELHGDKSATATSTSTAICNTNLQVQGQ